MSDQTPQRDQPARDDVSRPVMRDHLDLEPDDVPEEPAESGDNPMARLLIPGAIVLVIVLIIIAFLIFS